MMTKDEAQAYARKIRNPHKKAYAVAWIAYVFDGATVPNYDRNTLSVMGAQAVRLAIGGDLR